MWRKTMQACTHASWTPLWITILPALSSPSSVCCLKSLTWPLKEKNSRIIELLRNLSPSQVFLEKWICPIIYTTGRLSALQGQLPESVRAVVSAAWIFDCCHFSKLDNLCFLMADWSLNHLFHSCPPAWQRPRQHQLLSTVNLQHTQAPRCALLTWACVVCQMFLLNAACCDLKKCLFLFWHKTSVFISFTLVCFYVFPFLNVPMH